MLISEEMAAQQMAEEKKKADEMKAKGLTPDGKPLAEAEANGTADGNSSEATGDALPTSPTNKIKAVITNTTSVGEGSHEGGERVEGLKKVVTTTIVNADGSKTTVATDGDEVSYSSVRLQCACAACE